MHYKLLGSLLLVLLGFRSAAQTPLSMKEALAFGLNHYGTILAKQSYAQASEATVIATKREYLPNINFAAQQDYGTVNGQLGPLYGFGGLNIASSGSPLSGQSWNAAFGSLYLTNINWNFFSFGKVKQQINTAKANAQIAFKDWQQVSFQHEVKIAAAYLNLLAAQQLTHSYEKNLLRADTIRYLVSARAHSGLIAGVDSSQANAERSNAYIVLLKARDWQQEKNSELAQLLGIPVQEFLLDTSFIAQLPDLLQQVRPKEAEHPLLQWYQSRRDMSEAQLRYLKTLYYPSFSFVAAAQTRGSGFGNNYISNNQDYSNSYWQGIRPTSSNYLIGIGLTWNMTQVFRVSAQVSAQKLMSKGLQYEYDLAAQQVAAQLSLSETKIKNALSAYQEVPLQLKAASDAYLQKTVLYQNGLSSLVEVTQALYVLVRAETDRDIAYNNVWQALLLKAAAVGDFDVFESQF